VEFDVIDCPVCRGAGHRPGPTLVRYSGLTRRTRTCRRCRGIGIITR